MAAVRGEHAWLPAAGTAVVIDGSGFTWWTFAGRGVNATLAAAIQTRIAGKVGHDNFAIKVEAEATPAEIEADEARAAGLDRDSMNKMPPAGTSPEADPTEPASGTQEASS